MNEEFWWYEISQYYLDAHENHTQKQSVFILNTSMEHSPGTANSSQATQQIPNIFWNPKVHYRKHNSQQTVPVLSQITPEHVPPFYS
jgi:hypothetical protein